MKFVLELFNVFITSQRIFIITSYAHVVRRNAMDFSQLRSTVFYDIISNVLFPVYGDVTSFSNRLYTFLSYGAIFMLLMLHNNQCCLWIIFIYTQVLLPRQVADVSTQWFVKFLGYTIDRLYLLIFIFRKLHPFSHILSERSIFTTYMQ